MSPAREAIVLPVVFLSVILLGGLRFDDQAVATPPSLFALILAMMLFAALIQSGTIAAERLVGAHRNNLANLNGLAVLLTCFMASAQCLSLLMPRSGLPQIVVGLTLLLLLLQVLAIGVDRSRLARGLLVAFGAAFTLKFIVLAAISAPAPTRVGRALQVLFETATLGALAQPQMAPWTGYLAFFVLVLYLFGLALLPHADWQIVRVALPSSAGVEALVESRAHGSIEPRK